MRDHTMFGFLGQGSTKVASLDILKEYAKHAAHSFMGKDQVPLSHTIQKTASVENLTPEEISIVCQEANKGVHAQLFKSAEDKYIDFEIADPSVIVSNIEKSIQKTASADSYDSAFDFAFGKTASKESGISEFDISPDEAKTAFGDFQVTGTNGHDGLKVPQYHIDKVAALRDQGELDDIVGDIIIIESQIEGIKSHFVKTARNQLLSYNLHERAAKFPGIAQFCKEAGMKEKGINELMDLTAHVMHKQGLLEKTADLKAGADLISNDLDAKVINGTHPLFITIQTLADKETRREALMDRHNLIKTRLDEYADGVKNRGSVIQGQTVKEL